MPDGSCEILNHFRNKLMLHFALFDGNSEQWPYAVM